MDSKMQKSKLKPLPSEIQSIVRSGITINSVAQCVEELVYNSIDAGAKSIRIGVNLDQFNVRVEDDGVGLSEMDLEVAGTRYNTSKCNSIADLNKLAFYGFRGEALASIVKISNTVDIITRPKAAPRVELKKKFENGDPKGFVEKYNTSIKTSGTTVIVGKLLSMLPVRQQRIDKSLQLEEVKGCLEKIALINPSLNIELRNEKNGTQLFCFQPSSCYADAINQIFTTRIGFEVRFIEEHFLHNKLFFNLSVSSDFVRKKHYQFVFLNNRFIRRCRIHKWVGNFILDRRKDSDSQNSDKYPIFILNITCPFGEYDVTLEPKKQAVEFKDWDAVYSGIDGLVTKLKHKNSFACLGSNSESLDKNTSLISSYDVKGALHSRFVTRDTDVSSAKSSQTSGQGSFGRKTLPKPEINSSKRNLTRTGHSTHVVNVREIRKKRKLENAATSKPAVISKPLKTTLDQSNSKPNLTLRTFNKFAEWNDEFKKLDPVPPKRLKESHHQEDYKYYVPDLHSHERANPIQQANESSHFAWKINKYLDNYQPGASESVIGMKDASIDSKESPVPQPHSILRNSGCTKKETTLCPKTPKSADHGAEGCVFEWSDEVVKKHFYGKLTISVKEDILKRLFKYYRTTDKRSLPKVKSSNSSNLSKKTNIKPNEEKSSTAIQIPNSAVKPVKDVESRIEKPQVPNVSFLKTPLDSEIPKLSLNNTGPFSVTNSESCLTNCRAPHTQQFNELASQITANPNGNNVSHTDPQNLKQSNLEAKDFRPCVTQPHQQSVPITTFNSHPEMSFKPGWKIFGENTSSEVEQPSFSVLKQPQLNCFQISQGKAEGKTSVPPLLNLFPIQKSFSTDWNDQMMSNDYAESDNDLFPSDWGAEIVIGSQGQEWLETLDNNGRRLYINLSTGDSTYDIPQGLGPVRKVTVAEMKRTNPIRFNWLRKHFPRGFKQFWSGHTREVAKEGDLSKLNSSVIGESLLKCINKKKEDDYLSKWTKDELQNVSKYFSDSNATSTKSINNITASGIQCWKDLGGTTSSFRFNREDFEFIRVIGQYDRKFILAGIRKSSVCNETLVIFDQHAVHERIRLEQLIADSFMDPKSVVKFLKGRDLIPPYSLPLSETEVRIMLNYAELFRQAALKFEIVSSTLAKIKMVPKCFVEKCANEPTASRDETFRNLVHSLIQELIHSIMETKTARLSSLPKVVHNILCSQACHGAIKFGDVLDSEQCKELILNIRKCKNLFQCAHGRPTVVPLITSQDMLKVLEAGQTVFQNRQTCLVSTNPCLSSNEEYSEYFPSEEKTSGYFSFLHSPTTPKKLPDDTLVAKDITPTNNEQQSKESSTTDFFSLISREKSSIKDDELSSYFFGCRF